MRPGSPDAVRAVLTVTIRPQDAAAFERAWTKVADWVRHQPGCLRQTLCRSGRDASVYVIASDWVDGEAFRRFERSDEQDAITAELRRLRLSAQMDVQHVVDHKERG